MGPLQVSKMMNSSQQNYCALQHLSMIVLKIACILWILRFVTHYGIVYFLYILNFVSLVTVELFFSLAYLWVNTDVESYARWWLREDYFQNDNKIFTWHPQLYVFFFLANNTYHLQDVPLNNSVLFLWCLHMPWRTP